MSIFAIQQQIERVGSQLFAQTESACRVRCHHRAQINRASALRPTDRTRGGAGASPSGEGRMAPITRKRLSVSLTLCQYQRPYIPALPLGRQHLHPRRQGARSLMNIVSYSEGKSNGRGQIFMNILRASDIVLK